MSDKQFETILEKIAYVDSHRQDFRQPDLIIRGLEAKLLQIDNL